MRRGSITAHTVIAVIIISAAAFPSAARPSAAQPRTGVDPISSPAPDRARVAEVLRSSPVMFVENVGQFDDGVRFQVRGGDRTIWLADDAIWVTIVDRPAQTESLTKSKDQPAPSPFGKGERVLTQPEGWVPRRGEGSPRRGVNIKVSFPDSNPHPVTEPFDRLDTHVSYFLGNDPSKWQADVPVWGGVRYKDLYPGIDLEVTGEGGRLVQRVIASAESNPGSVRLRAEGADEVDLAVGGVRLKTAIGEFTLPLLSFSGRMDASGSNPAQPAAFSPQVDGNTIAAPFRVASTSGRPSAKGQTDAVPAASDLAYATFLGGSSIDSGRGIAVDASGAAYVTGDTLSSDFPVATGAYDTSSNGLIDAFVVKVNAAGFNLAYATFLGGSDYDNGDGIVVDTSGAAYVTGRTHSSNFPVTTDAYDTSFNGGTYDAFAVKVNATGSNLVYASFLGGSNYDYGYGIAVDTSGEAYLTGATLSSDFPVTSGAHDTSFNFSGDAFVVKVNGTGSSLAYATFIGGGSSDYGRGIAVDTSGAAYVTGETASSDFPVTTGAYDTSHNGGSWDAFVVKLAMISPALLGITPAQVVSMRRPADAGVFTQTVQISNTGGRSLDWTASVSPTVGWLGFSPVTGTVSSGSTGILFMTMNKTGLPAGWVSSAVNVVSNGGAYTLPVRLYVGDYRTLSLPIVMKGTPNQ
ncbi:MAG: SBBP repeat-containing protein [Chloroflexi bacterium]|nr:SBBP repeat-containing protein [Chloroflexota bacterium]